MSHKSRHLDGLLSPYEKIKPVLLSTRPNVALLKHPGFKRFKWPKLVVWREFLMGWKKSIQLGDQVDVRVVTGQFSEALNPGRAQLVAPQPWFVRFCKCVKRKIFLDKKSSLGGLY